MDGVCGHSVCEQCSEKSGVMMSEYMHDDIRNT